MDRRGFITNGLIFLAGLPLVACEQDRRERRGRPIYRHSPPPEAPAHGYRHRHERGPNLVYDSNLGVYRVVGRRDEEFFYRGRFYRYRRGKWAWNSGPETNWRPTSGRELPRPLRRWAERRDNDRRGRGRRDNN
ncbi:MAG TPA: hypothetical protein VLN73_01105 [Alphaproteobacteria bacterium]|nr:hypothetical protein [Alphaproteobacteria bacterium]